MPPRGFKREAFLALGLTEGLTTLTNNGTNGVEETKLNISIQLCVVG